jgi:hypothetical protein
LILKRIRASSKLINPFTVNGVLSIIGWEYFAQIKFVEICTEVIVTHPPVSITLEGIIQLFLQAFLIIPSFIFICKFACPFSSSPRISDSD